jgi:aldehyde dehydrogenase (NAD+)
MDIAKQMMELRAGFLAGGPKKLLIDGRWVSALSGKTLSTINPANGETVARIAEAGKEDVDLAVAAARRAFQGEWRAVRPYQRQMMLLKLAELVDRHFDELSLLDSIEMGAPVKVTGGGRYRALGRIRFNAAMAMALHGETIENSLAAEVFSYTLKEPVGVVGAIIPWNAPLGMAIWKIAPAIATGCTIVIKPSEEASLSTLRLGELVLEAGVPPGVVNVVTGYGDPVGASLAMHPDVDKVAFTGSVATGQKLVLASAGNFKRLTLELGGKSPNIVFADADLEDAVPGAAMAAFTNSGQVCSAGTRLLVQRPIYDRFVERVAAFGSALRLGDTLDPETDLGPLVSNRQLERVMRYIDIGRNEGARTASGGQRVTSGRLGQGFYVQPTVLSDVRNDMRVAQEEIFGPVLSAIAFDTEEEAIAIANQTQYGLGSGIWTRDVTRVQYLSRRIRAGSVWVNCYQAMDPAVPFGGFKMSGYGREGGREHLDEFLASKSVWIKASGGHGRLW